MTNAERLGLVVQLLSTVPRYSRYTVDDVMRLFAPALQLNQIRVYVGDAGDPVGLATWAWVSDAVLARVLTGGDVAVNEWCSGPHLVFVDFIAPFGHAHEIVSALRPMFPKRKVYAVRRDQTGRARKFAIYWGQLHG